MSRITLFKGLLMNLNQEIKKGRREYLSRDEAYQKLKALTGQDFGYDVEKWRSWIKQNKVTAKNPKGTTTSTGD
jgi:hypothetical protein